MLRKISMVLCFIGWLLYVLHDLVLIGWKRAALTILASVLYGSLVLLVKEGEDATDRTTRF